MIGVRMPDVHRETDTKTILRAEFEVRLAVAMVAARLLMRYWLISGSTSIAKFRNDSCHPR